jgi:hypothetical protein
LWHLWKNTSKDNQQEAQQAFSKQFGRSEGTKSNQLPPLTHGLLQVKIIAAPVKAQMQDLEQKFVQHHIRI